MERVHGEGCYLLQERHSNMSYNSQGSPKWSRFIQDCQIYLQEGDKERNPIRKRGEIKNKATNESPLVEPDEGMDYNKAGSSDVRKVDKINKNSMEKN